MSDAANDDWPGDAAPEWAAAYLIRTARPNASDADVARAVASVLADPTYREELARDATTRLIDDVNRAMAILLRHDRRGPEGLATFPPPAPCACGFPDRHTNLPCNR